MHTMELYDKTTDPEEHLGVYKAQMSKMWATLRTVVTSQPL